MNRYLSIYLYVLLSLSFAACAAILSISIVGFCRRNKIIKYWHWIILLLIVCVGVFFRFFWITNQFRVFYDGYEICNLSRTIADEKKFTHCQAGTINNCEREVMTKRPPAFAFLGAMAMKISGTRNYHVVLRLNSVIGVLCIIMIFLLAAAASEDVNVALFCALMTSILPLHIMMSTNASTETFNFLLICCILFFLQQFIKSGDVVQFIGMSAAFHLAFFNRSENVMFFIVLPIAALSCQKNKGRINNYFMVGWLVIIASILPLKEVFINIHNIHMAHMNAFYTNMPLQTLFKNMVYLCRNAYLPIPIVAFAIAGFLVYWRNSGMIAQVLAFYLFFTFIVMSLVNVGLWIGDFPRLMIAFTVTLFYWTGITINKISQMFSGRQKYGIAIIFALMLFGSTNMKPPAFHNISKYYDVMIRKYLPTIPRDCSFFSPSTEVFYLYSNNRAYKIGRLLDDSFVAKHNECKIVVREALCALNYKSVCDKVGMKYDETIIYHNKFPNSYDYTISIINGPKQE